MVFGALAVADDPGQIPAQLRAELFGRVLGAAYPLGGTEPGLDALGELHLVLGVEPSRAHRAELGWRCEPTSCRCSHPGIQREPCHGKTGNDASYDAARTKSSRSPRTVPLISSTRP